MELLKGQKIKVGDLTNSLRIKLKVAVQMKFGEADVTCFGVDENSMLSDDRYFIFYNQTSSPEGALFMQIGASGTEFSIDLNKIPKSIKKLVVTVAADGQAAMKDVNKGMLSLEADGKVLADFPFLGAQFQQEKAVILCELYEKDGIWRLAVVSSGFNGGLPALLQYFGGEEMSETQTPLKPQKVESQQIKPKQAKAEIQIEEKPTVEPTIKTEAEPTVKTRVKLEKSGDTHKISLQKNKQEIHVNLNWNMQGTKKGFFGFRSNSSIDLDLACMYQLKTGEKGVIQALGNSFGSADRVPYIFLDQDDRTGSSQNGENMWFKKPELIEFAIVFAYIYEGVPKWKNTDASVILKQQGAPDIEIHLSDCTSQERFCVIASLTAKGNELEVRREERFFKGHREVDHAYGFGFRWQAGRK